MTTPLRLPFEKEIYELEDLLAKLEADANGATSEEVRRIRRPEGSNWYFHKAALTPEGRQIGRASCRERV